jgi:hypothetical protein
VVVRIGPADASRLISAFAAPQFYLSQSAVEEAVRTRRMFNLLEIDSGEKVGFWLLTNSAFDQSRFARRQRTDVGECFADVSSPEDTILMKLSWAKMAGGSEKQFHDALRVYELQADGLDRAYLNHWASALDVGQLWARLLTVAQPIDLSGEESP